MLSVIMFNYGNMIRRNHPYIANVMCVFNMFSLTQFLFIQKAFKWVERFLHLNVYFKRINIMIHYIDTFIKPLESLYYLVNGHLKHVFC